MALVSGALLISGLEEIYFSYQENKTALVRIQHEKAVGAASKIEQFIKEIQSQLGWVVQTPPGAGPQTVDQRRNEYLRLLRQVPAVTEISHLDPSGREQLRVSRLAMNVAGSQADLSQDPRFREARTNRVYFGPVYFRNESEPYMTLALAESGPEAGVTVAEVNLKFTWDVVSQIKIGRVGYAYVVDSRGQLVAHPDISLVLQKTDLSSLPQVQAARSGARASGEQPEEITIASDLQGRQVLTAYDSIDPPGWSVFVEQPLEEAFEPLYSSILRTALLLLIGLVLSVLASLVLARKMVRPIQALQAGAARIGAGALDQRIEVQTGDELEALAEEFNRMTGQLRESYAGLEQKVEERTRDLSEALEQQTATSEILRVISSSPTELQPVLDAVAENAARVCGANDGQIFRLEGDVVRKVAAWGPMLAAWPVGDALPLTRGILPGRAMLGGQAVHVHDMAAESEADFPGAKKLQKAIGYRTALAAPLLREGAPIGAIVIRRMEVRPFTDKQIELLKTFADQAVIAIENVRLFQELQDRTAELGRSVEELKALGEVSQTVSSSLDLQQVLTTIVAHAVELSGGDGGAIYEFDESRQEFELRTTHRMSEELIEAVQRTRIQLGETPIGQAALRREAMQVADIRDEPAFPMADVLLRSGFRAVLAVPLLREESIVGALVVRRELPGQFDEKTVGLLQTFASQSVLAIQNARLFQEIEDKGRQLEVASRHKSEFLANMSHELRTPLNAIIGFSEVLIERMFGELNEKQDEYLQDILGSGRHLLSLINDILDLAKVEAGRMELELGSFSLPEALENGLTMIKERAASHGIALSMSLDPAIGIVEADERKIKQVVFNLLSNAVKFTPDGGQVELSAQLVDGEVQIAVRDTGIGIPAEDQELIFEEFRQSGPKREGTGLGLALTKKLVELHGGRIWVESELARGSTFTFAFPARAGQAAEVAAPEAPRPAAVLTEGSASTVLLIEDDQNSIDLLSLYLGAAGFEVAVARDGQEGLEMARRLRPAVITLDIMLPRLDGWDFLTQAKAEPALADIPVIIVSMLDERGKGFALGAAEYLVKPVRREDLLATLRRVAPVGPALERPAKVLAIDDDPMAVDLIQAVLEPAGYRVLTASGGEEGIAVAIRELPDLVILDLLMPDVDGFAVVERLRAEPATKPIPIVILTSKAMSQQEKERLNGQISYLARKGEFNRTAFIDLVRGCCQTSHQPSPVSHQQTTNEPSAISSQLSPDQRTPAADG